MLPSQMHVAGVDGAQRLASALLGTGSDLLSLRRAHSHHVLWCSRGGERGPGRSGAPQAWLDLVHPDDRARVATAYACLQDVPAVWVRYRLAVDGLHWQPCCELARATGTGGAQPTYLAIATLETGPSVAPLLDNALLTAKVRVLESRLDAMQVFGHAVAHELRTPLRTIEGAVGHLLNEAGPFSGRMATRLQHIRSASRSMDRTIDELLRYARVDGEPSVVEVLDLAVEVEAVLGRLAAELDRHGVTVVHRLHAGPVLADAVGLRLVLRNLLDKLIGQVAAAGLTRIDICSRREADRVWLSISDAGPGALAAMCRPPSHSGGCGIGQALARRALERMGGWMWTESAPDGGTSIHINLPDGSACDPQGADLQRWTEAGHA